jgi:hypothetical protein
MSTIKISDSNLDSFYSQNPDFDILQYNLCDETALSQLNWQNLDRPALVELLKKYQRLLRLNPNPEIAKKLLNPSPDNAGRLRATPGDTINNSGLDSAHAIAAIPETEFIQNYSASAEGEASARQLHQKATAVKATITLLWANIQNMVAAPHFRAMQANNIADSIHQFENFPNYQDLFGSLDYCKCEHCQSIFSPAAYFVDLMRITQEHITSKNNIDPKFTLNTRRPDLAQIPLTCENTNNLLPYLDIVNKVLALKVYNLNNPSPTPTTENEKIDNAYNILATATYPFNLPFNLPLEQIRAYLRQLNTNLATVYKTFNVAEKNIAREYLGLSIEEYNLITTPKPTADDLSKVYGVDVSASGFGGLINVETFRHQTGLSRQELNDLLYQNLSQAEIENGLAHNFYINQVLPGRQYLSVGNLIGYWLLNEDSGTTIYDKAGNNNGTLQGTPNWQTATDFPKGSRSVLLLDGATHIEIADPFENLTNFTIEAWVKPSVINDGKYHGFIGKQDPYRKPSMWLAPTDGGLHYWSVSDSGSIFNGTLPNFFTTINKWVQVIWVKDGAEYRFYRDGELFATLPAPSTVYTDRTTKYFIGGVDNYWQGQIAEVRIWSVALSADLIKANYSNPNLIAINNLNLATLDRINRFVRLAKKLNWSFAELDWVLHSIGVTETKDIDENAIIQIAKIKQLAAAFNQPLDVVCSFIFDLKTIGVGDSQNSQALFDIIFNNSKLLQGKPPYHPTSYNYLTSSNYPTYPGNALYSDTPLSTSDPNNKTRIAAGLGISLDDLTSLINAFWKPKTESDVPKSKTEPGVDVPKLSILYRHSKLAAFLRLPIDQYLILLRLINQHKSVFVVQDIVDILDHVAWLMNLGFNVYELDYILNGNESAFAFNKYNDKDIQSFLQTLWTLSVSSPSELEVNDIIDWTSFLSRIKEPINQQKDILIQRLWELFPQSIQESINSQKLSEDKKEYKPLTQDNKNQIIQALNEILYRRDFYQEDKFKEIQISNDIQQLLVSPEILLRNEIYKLNRLLLENSFPNEIAKGKIQEIGYEWKNTLDEWKNTLIEQLATFLGESTSIITALLELINKFTTLPNWFYSYTDVFLTPLQDTDFNESNPSWEYIKTILHSLARYLLLNQKLQLTQTEIDSVVSYPDCYGIEFPQPLSIDNIKSLYTFKQLTKAFNDTQDRLIQYFDLLQDNLVGYWPVNEGNGAVISDIVGNTNGTLQGTANWQTATDFPGGSRSVLQFDGTSNYIQLPAMNFDYSQGFTVESWVYYEEFNKFSRIIDFGNGQGQDNIVFANEDTTNNLFFLVLPEDSPRIKASNALEEKKWMYLVATVDGSGNAKIYKNGQLIQSGKQNVPKNIERQNNYIGKSNWPGDALFKGQIAEVRIWNVALSADVIEAKYNNPNFTNLAQITSWKQEQINYLATHFNNIPNLKKSVAGILQIKNAFYLSQSLGIDISSCDKILALADTGVDGNNWEIYTNTAQSISEILKAKYNDDDWAKVSDKLNSELKELKRNALTAFTLWKINQDNQENNSIQTLRNLSEYLLIDVETSGCASISYIKQAILSMQMYLQRCRLNLELGVNNIDIPEIWWEWMMNYRVWEANRKVFLYPENYIEPNLRKSKSDLFQEFEAELLQSDITPESVEAAYYNYFDKLAELAQLKIASTYRCFVKQANNPKPVDTLFIFGKTATEPVTYYYRECTVNKGEKYDDDSIIWDYWSKIDVSINSDYISPVFAFNKLFIFWVEIKEITTETSTKETEKKRKRTATIKYTFQTVGKKWMQSQTLSQDIAIDSDDMTWKKVYPLAISQNNSEEILIIFGNYEQLQDSYKFKQPVLLSASLLKEENQSLRLKGIWNTNKLPQASSGLAATTVGNLAIFAEGDTVEIYNAKTQQWSIHKFSQYRYGLAATTVGNLAIFAEGDTVEIYNVETQQWSTHELSQARRYMAATTVGNLAIFAGGCTDSNGIICLNTVDIYNVETRQWSTDKLSQARYEMAATTVGNLAIFAGGKKNNKDIVDTVEIYNAKTQQWSAHKLSQARSGLAATTVGNLAIFAGGYIKSNDVLTCVDTVDIYNVETQQWSTHKLSQVRSGLAATTVGNLAIFAGGSDWTSNLADVETQPSQHRFFDTVDIYNVETQQWSTHKLSQARSGLTATTVGNLAIFAGGFNSSYPLHEVDTVDIYKLNVVRDNYTSDSTSTSKDGLSQVNNLASMYGLDKVSQANSSFLTVKNDPGWATINNGDEAFLVIPQNSATQPINEDLTISSSDSEITLFYTGYTGKPATDDNSKFIRLTTNSPSNLSQKAFIGGIDHLLTLDSQLTPELDFTRINLSSSAIAPKSKTLDFNGSFGLYFQEIFFHIPFLVANTLNTNQRFAEAQKWYHYIFNPTQQKQNHEGLVGYWQLNEETGTTISDKAGNNNGTVQGTPNWQKATDFPGGSRSVLQFENNIAIAVPLNEPETEVTHELWFKTDSPNGGLFSVTNGIEPGNGDDRHLYLSNGNIKARIWNNEIIGSSNLNLADNKWHHVAHVFGASISGQKIYIDGQLVASGSKASSDFNWQNTIFIGYSYDAKPQYFQGQIAEVRIWNKALSTEQILENASPNPSDRFWRYLPFRGNTFAKLQDILTNSQAIAAYNNDPFDPHAIAQLRIGAYQKTIMMKYIDNLLDWGDNLFAQDNWESITQATMLYLLAYDLLGAKPENLGKCKVPKPATFQNIQQKYQGKEIPEFLIELENMLADSPTSALTSTPFNDLNAYFGVSENEQFTAYWDRVEDRLYKIRHCQNIEGLVRQLALFEPPIDPSQLVRAVASGNVPMSVISGLTAEVPHYRFDYMLERARNIISTVIQLGSSLLSTLEKKDAEQISLLRSTHESVMLRLIQTTKEKQINEAQANLESLNKSLEAAKDRVDHYYNLISGGLNASEISSLALAGTAIRLETDANKFNTLAAASYLLPNIFGLADGGMNFGAAVQMAGATLSGIASNLNQGSSLAATIAQYERRTEDWQLQLQMAQDDVNLITQQITASLIYVDIATCELKAHQKSIEQANEVEDFFKNKFSNQDLYQWMVSRLSVLYFQTFKIALDMALATQKAYQYELNKDDTYISFDYWDSLKKGLLAGEGLMFGLNQLEKAYIEGNERKLEIEKTISLRTLKTLDNDPFEKLKAGGKCKFELNEKLFEDDFPGHYCRQIKTISISIPAVIGSYENIKATLTQLSDKILLKPNLNAVNYLLGNKQGSTQPDTSILRSSWRRNQKIALSKGVNDTGLFELNFRDERYLPFEGTGAISTWELSLPSKPSDQNSNIDSQSLSDVIINLSYTALAGDDEFQKNVEALRDKKH